MSDPDPLADVTAEVAVHIVASAADVWALVTNLSRTPDWNRETLVTAWIPPAIGPAVGATFRATNRIGDWQWDVECHVTRADPDEAFEWTVSSPDNPSTRWWHRLTPHADGTELRHGFRHGPAGSGLRAMVDQNPGGAPTIIAQRLAMLEGNMRFTVDRIKALAEQGAPTG